METIVTEAQNCRVETMLILILEMIAPLLLKQQLTINCAEKDDGTPFPFLFDGNNYTTREQNRAAYYNSDSAYISSRG